MKSKELADVDIPEIFTIDYLTMSDGAKLRRLYFHPENSRGTILLYPGMNTLVLSWIKVLNLLSEENFSIEYVESREKYTSILEKHHKVTRERMLQDCVDAIDQLNLNGSQYIAIGSSLGSVTLIHNLANKSISTPHVVLVGPPLKLAVPLAFRLLLYFVSDFTYKLFMRRLAKFILLRAYTNEKTDPQQRKKYALALDLANIGRLKKSLRAWLSNELNDDLPKIDGGQSKCYLIGASEDLLHPDTDTRYIADNIENAEFIDLKTNTAAHDQPIVDFIKSISLSS